MPSLKGKEYKRFEDIKHIREDGSEYWSARELAPTLEYTQWRNFENVIKRAMIACENSGHSIFDDFAEVSKIVEAGATSKPKKIMSSPDMLVTLLFRTVIPARK